MPYTPLPRVSLCAFVHSLFQDDFLPEMDEAEETSVLDAYGHLSVRHPTVSDRFIMPRNLAPALLSSETDLVEYFVSNASPVDPTAPKGYVERYIHSEIYKQYPGVNSVIHSHASEVISYTISGPKYSLSALFKLAPWTDGILDPIGVPLKPCFHMAGFLGMYFESLAFE